MTRSAIASRYWASGELSGVRRARWEIALVLGGSGSAVSTTQVNTQETISKARALIGTRMSGIDGIERRAIRVRRDGCPGFICQFRRRCRRRADSASVFVSTSAQRRFVITGFKLAGQGYFCRRALKPRMDTNGHGFAKGLNEPNSFHSQDPSPGLTATLSPSEGERPGA